MNRAILFSASVIVVSTPALCAVNVSLADGPTAENLARVTTNPGPDADAMLYATPHLAVYSALGSQ
jgi:hypothetical protein